MPDDQDDKSRMNREVHVRICGSREVKVLPATRPPDVIGSGARKSNTGGSRTMPMDAYRDGNQLIIQFDMPGIDPDSLEINVENNTLPATCYRVHCCQASSSGCSSSYPR
jgi:hypothetical protein